MALQDRKVGGSQSRCACCRYLGDAKWCKCCMQYPLCATCGKCMKHCLCAPVMICPVCGKISE
jgi:hypothetical protein